MGLQQVEEIEQERSGSATGTYWAEDPYIPQRDTEEYWRDKWESNNAPAKPESLVIQDISADTQVSPAFVRYKLSEHGIHRTDPADIGDRVQRRHLKSLFGINMTDDDGTREASGVLGSKLR